MKVSKWLLGVLTAVSMMLMVGCSDDGKDNDTGNGNGGGKGSISEHEGNNAVLTGEDEESFMIFAEALVSEIQLGMDNGKVLGEHGGYCMGNITHFNPEPDYEVIGSGEYFDYSHGGELFIGGQISIEIDEGEGEGETKIYQKMNGTLEFRGSFKGSISFKNAAVEMNSTTFDERKYSGEIVITSGGKTLTLPKEAIMAFFAM